MTIEPKIGDVWTVPIFSAVPLRVLALDHLEVLFDRRSPSAPDSWLIGTDAKHSPGYTRMPLDWLVENGVRHSPDPLTDYERGFHRCDLPLRMFRTKHLAWGPEPATSKGELEVSVNALVDGGSGGLAIQCEKIIVIPVKPSRAFAVPAPL